METVEETPTARSDYALVSLSYLALLGGIAESSRRRGDALVSLEAGELVPLSLAAFALSKMIVHEKVESWIRAPFVDEQAGGEKRPKGRRLRFAVGELFTCTRCMGAWAALGLMGVRTVAPPQARLLTSVLAVSAGSDFLHSAFTLICRRGEAIGG